MEICEFFIVYISCTSMGAKTLPLDCRRKERNQRFLYVFLERIREKEGEKAGHEFWRKRRQSEGKASGSGFRKSLLCFFFFLIIFC